MVDSSNESTSPCDLATRLISGLCCSDPEEPAFRSGLLPLFFRASDQQTVVWCPLFLQYVQKVFGLFPLDCEPVRPRWVRDRARPDVEVSSE